MHMCVYIYICSVTYTYILFVKVACMLLASIAMMLAGRDPFMKWTKCLARHATY